MVVHPWGMHTPLPRASRIVLAFDGVAYLALGLWLCADPTGGLAGVQVAALNPIGETELRAMYGGLEVGLGIFGLHAARNAALGVAALWANVYVLTGLAAARAAGVLLGGGDSPIMRTLLSFELVSLAVNVWALRAARAATSAPPA
jgi:hypothetical protein